MRPTIVALLVVALVAGPLFASAAAGPMYFQKQYRWLGTYTPGYYHPVDSFSVPSSAALLCYVRWTIWDGSDMAATFRATLEDGAGRLVVVDAGSAVNAPDFGVSKVTLPVSPVKPNGLSYTPGTFELRFEGEGFHGNWEIQVYAVSTPSECGSLPP